VRKWKIAIRSFSPRFSKARLYRAGLLHGLLLTAARLLFL
jgi:hypothetical protein